MHRLNGPAVHGATSENSVIDWRRWLAPMNPLGNSLDCDNRLSASRSGKAIILNVKTSTNRSLYRCLLRRSLAEFSPLKLAQISTKLSAFSGFNCLDRNLSGFSSQYFMIIYLESGVVISWWSHGTLTLDVRWRWPGRRQPSIPQ